MSQTKSNDLWVERFVRYIAVQESAVAKLQESMPPDILMAFYEEGPQQQMMEDSMMFFAFSPDNQEAQEAFYEKVDGICQTLESVEGDYKALFWISLAAYAGAFAICIGGHQFPHDSSSRVEIVKRAVPKIQAIMGGRKAARSERKAAQWYARHTDPPVLASMPKSSGLGLKMDESVRYLHLETGKQLEFVVLGFRRSREGGVRYTVAYVGNADVEVELSEDEMKGILDLRISAY